MFLCALGRGEEADGEKGVEGQGMPRDFLVCSLGGVWVEGLKPESEFSTFIRVGNSS